MITGFNTDIEHDGVVYHVQTEDKGLETPIILSLVYVGGAILASKRAPYQDLIAQGFSDEVLSERLKRQHRLICAAINSGRIEDLKKMSGQKGSTAPLPPIEGLEVPRSELEPEPDTVFEFESEAVVDEPELAIEDKAGEVEAAASDPDVDELEEVATEPETETDAVAATEIESDEFEIASIPSQVWVPPVKEEPPPAEEPSIPIVLEDPHDEAYTVHDQRGHSPSDFDQGLTIFLLDDDEFNSGEARTMRVLVVNRHGGAEKPMSGAAVSIKILGTAFRPQIYSLKTDRDGVATVATQIPKFTTGRAAVLVRAVIKEDAAELRRVIHPGK